MKQVAEIAGPWTVAFDPKWGGPEKVVFEKLDDWTKRPEEGIKYYSGTAVYKKTFDLADLPSLPKKGVFLDLGTVNYLARVRLNGQRSRRGLDRAVAGRYFRRREREGERAGD